MTTPTREQVIQWAEDAGIGRLNRLTVSLDWYIDGLERLVSIAYAAGAEAERKTTTWQPIETAPKDGARVLLCIDHGEWGDKVWTGLWADGWMVSYGKSRTEPTHWMPIPAAPAAIRARSKP